MQVKLEEQRGLCLKENVKPYTRGLREILGINPIYYNYTANSGKNSSKEPTVGIAAQEIQKLIPEAVTVRKNIKMKDGTVL